MKEMKEKKITVVGGDVRQLVVADFFASRGYDVTVCGINDASSNEIYNVNFDVWDTVKNASVLILPLPLSTDSIRLNMPMYDGADVRISHLAEIIPFGAKVYAGKVTEEFREACKKRDAKLVDYFENECLCIKNALLTAEASADIVMRELPFSLSEAKIMVIGYGRVGKLLSDLLLRMNANVTVAARKKEDLVYAECAGAHTVRIDPSEEHGGLLEINNGYDVVFNTVPVCLIDRRLIEKLGSGVVLIDLASSPGGIDIRAAKERGIKSIWALSLPGKYSPRRAGQIIAETIFEDLEGR